MLKKKFQVFVSSTYEDLLDERQAAVEAILKFGHIPAGMELFAAGSQSQMEVIREWIDESDIFLLILGGRYGSIDPKTNKSYIELEYEYAIERDKPFFAVVMADASLDAKVKDRGQTVLELDRRDDFKRFRDIVRSKICKSFNDPKTLQAAIYESLVDIIRKHEDKLSGWVSGRDVQDPGDTLKRFTDLMQENQRLREALAATKGSRKGESIESASKSTGEGSTGFGRRDLPPP